MNRAMAIGLGSGLLAGALWGLVFIAPHWTPDFTSLQMSSARYLAYGLVAAALAAPRWRTMTAALTRRDWLVLAWLGLTGNIAYYIFLALGVAMAGAAETSLIIGLLPVTVAIIGSRDEGAVALRALAPSLLLAVAGVALTAWAALSHGGVSGGWRVQAIGLACAMGSLGCWTIFAIGNSRALARLRGMSAQDWSLLFGVVTGVEALVLAVPAFLLPPAHHDSATWLRFAGISLGLAIGASVIGNALWNSASRRLPLTMTGQLILFETLFALLYSFVWERRGPSAVEVAAIAALIGAVWWCAASHRTAPD
jgi:drug/metabolite transporter (DMT)-like permease